MTHAEIAFAVVVGAISALGVIAAAKIADRSTDAAARLAARGVDNQISLNSTVKIAEFRQAWINDLRAAMAKLFAISLRGGVNDESELYELSAKIRLLMNREDVRYDELVTRMEQLIAKLHNQTRGQSEEFIRISQDILKNEWEVLKRDLARIPSSIVQ